MASTTRLKTSQSSTPYLRIGADEDYASTDVAHTDSKTTGLGSSVDIALHTDGDTTWATSQSAVFTNTGSPTALGSSYAGLLLLHIKHSGYKEAAKTNSQTAILKIFMDSNDTSKFFTLEANESITLHGFGSGSDNVSDWAVSVGSNTGVYVEITTCKAA
tara:strand:+ start:3497 stop:3976 length:480 start_codon:yes stop_codon:yes gene_type:complete